MSPRRSPADEGWTAPRFQAKITSLRRETDGVWKARSVPTLDPGFPAFVGAVDLHEQPEASNQPGGTRAKAQCIGSEPGQGEPKPALPPRAHETPTSNYARFSTSADTWRSAMSRFCEMLTLILTRSAHMPSSPRRQMALECCR